MENIYNELIKMGWNIKESVNCWEENGFYFFSTGDDDLDYTCQINPETGEYRTCGNGEGCFWTEWN